MTAFASLQRHHFRCIVMDCPTRFIGGTKGRPQHYPRMTDHELAALPVGDLAHPEGCFLFYWDTSARLYRNMGSRTRLRADEIAHAYGFRFSARAFVWVKTERGDQHPMFVHPEKLLMGTGLTTRKNAEDCLLFRRGRPVRLAKDVREVIMAPVRDHSRKPEEFFARVERFCAGPRLELFGRQSRPGWTVWGNEATKFDPAPVLMAAE